MPLFNKEHHNKGFVVGFWKIDEDLQALEEMMDFNNYDRNYYNRFLVDKRRKHWLASRILLKELAEEKFSPIIYNQDGKPYFSSGRGFFSLSHAGEMAAAIYSDVVPVGIDIEKITHKLLRVKERFLSDDELDMHQEGNYLDYLCLGWCGKEALYKIHGERKLDFRKHMMLKLPKISQSGHFYGAIKSDKKEFGFELQYKRISDYMAVFVAGEDIKRVV
mgnify:CR=1 FL=1